ncbi:DUF1801 domain-containing protein [Haladaptatus sp. CMSO5]|uniref:DUF1801 domain-containing protein n=1 Tax=Haladaptatus sp. CMSO5 TaxID=3120514 RepID=UPI002FCE054C
MSASDSLTPERVSSLVLANRVIRAPDYQSTQDDAVQYSNPDRGLQWGVDVIPALLGLSSVEQDPRDTNPNGWVGFARHWRGAILRIAFDLVAAHDDSDPVVVVTAITGREGTQSVVDDFGGSKLSDQVPTQKEWEDRDKRYHAARRKDTTDGSASVKAYIAALPGWKRERATQFDALIEGEVPEVRRAVRYHQPFYGIEEDGWFASFSAFSKHVKLSFVADEYLDPEPPTGTGPERQAIDLTETDTMDEDQVASWIRQAAASPGMNW